MDSYVGAKGLAKSLRPVDGHRGNILKVHKGVSLKGIELLARSATCRTGHLSVAIVPWSHSAAL